jgi:glycosyltransferase involved in cell wall biosynthesis
VQGVFAPSKQQAVGYLALDLSILALAPKGGNVDTIIDAGRCGYLLPYDTQSMVLELKEAFSDFKAGRARRASPDFIRRYSRKSMTTQLAKRMEKLL